MSFLKLILVFVSLSWMQLAFAGSCLPKDPNDSAAVSICRAQAGSFAGCKANQHLCYWMENNGFCAPNDPRDSQAQAICGRSRDVRTCLANSAFCSWQGQN